MNGSKSEASPLLSFSPHRPGNPEVDDDDAEFSPLSESKRTWSMIHGEYHSIESSQRAWHSSGSSSQVPAALNNSAYNSSHHQQHHYHQKAFPVQLLYSAIFALVNVIIGLPCLYGYATVIFQHDVYVPHWAALSKLIILSSLLFQLVFTACSGPPFVVGAVQDAGLVFLSHMATRIAVTIIREEESNDDADGLSAEAMEHQVLSTALVLLSLGTAVLGMVMVALGRFRLAEYIELLPMPAVGGYLAFIGMFCVQAGVSLSISKNLVSVTDWVYLVQQPDAFLLALPALLTGLLFTWLSRNASSDAALPLGMVGELKQVALYTAIVRVVYSVCMDAV